MTTGEKIAALRREQDWSQETLADQLGLSRQAVSKWEAGQTVPGMDNLIELAKLFHVSVDTLLRPDEPFPGKETCEKTAEPAAAVSVSYCPQLTKKAKWFIGGLAVLIAIATVCSVVSLVWAVQLQRQVDSLPLGGGTVYVPSDPQPSFTSEDIAGLQDSYLYDRESGRLQFDFHIVPKEFDMAETAQVMVQGEQDAVTVPAQATGNAYAATVFMKPENDYAVYLLLTKDGKTRNLLVTRYADLAQKFILSIESFAPVGELQQGEGGSTKKIGETLVEMTLALPDNGENYPVEGTVTMYAGDTALGTVQLNGMGMSPLPLYDDEGNAVALDPSYRDCMAMFPEYDLPKGARELHFDVSVTDIFGKQVEQSFDWQVW